MVRLEQQQQHQAISASGSEHIQCHSHRCHHHHRPIFFWLRVAVVALMLLVPTHAFEGLGDDCADNIVRKPPRFGKRSHSAAELAELMEQPNQPSGKTGGHMLRARRTECFRGPIQRRNLRRSSGTGLTLNGQWAVPVMSDSIPPPTTSRSNSVRSMINSNMNMIMNDIPNLELQQQQQQLQAQQQPQHWSSSNPIWSYIMQHLNLRRGGNQATSNTDRNTALLLALQDDVNGLAPVESDQQRSAVQSLVKRSTSSTGARLFPRMAAAKAWAARPIQAKDQRQTTLKLKLNSKANNVNNNNINAVSKD